MGARQWRLLTEIRLGVAVAQLKVLATVVQPSDRRWGLIQVHKSY